MRTFIIILSFISFQSLFAQNKHIDYLLSQGGSWSLIKCFYSGQDHTNPNRKVTINFSSNGTFKKNIFTTDSHLEITGTWKINKKRLILKNEIKKDDFKNFEPFIEIFKINFINDNEANFIYREGNSKKSKKMYLTYTKL